MKPLASSFPVFFLCDIWFAIPTHFWIFPFKSRNIAEPSVTKDYSALDEGDTIKSIAVSPYFLYRLEARERGSNGGIFVAPQNYRLASSTFLWSPCVLCQLCFTLRVFEDRYYFGQRIVPTTVILLRFLACIEKRRQDITAKIRKQTECVLSVSILLTLNTLTLSNVENISFV